jgi:phosphoglycolate phosphatase
VFINSFNQLADKHRFKKIEDSNIEKLKELSMLERLRYLNVPFYKLPFLTREFMLLYKSGIGSVSMIPGMLELLEKIPGSGLKMGILSSNSTSTIKTFVDMHGIGGIKDVYCSGKLTGKDRVFRSFLKEKNLSADDVIYVCDELRDIQACNRAGIKPVWVSWGFEREDAVKNARDFTIVHSPEELYVFIEKIIRKSNES